MDKVLPIRKATETGALMLAITVVAYGVYMRREEVINSISGIYGITGAAALVLMPLTLALITALLFAWITPSASRHGVRKTLGIVAALSPIAGFLGTTFGMMEAISALGMAEDIDALLNMVGQSLHGMSEAIASTSWGLLNAIFAVLYLRLEQSSVANDPAQSDTHQTENLLASIQRTLERIEQSQGNVYPTSGARPGPVSSAVQARPAFESTVNPD